MAFLMPIVIVFGWIAISISAILLWMVVGGFILIGLNILYYKVTKIMTGLEYGIVQASIFWPILTIIFIVEMSYILLSRFISRKYRKFIYKFYPEKYYEKYVHPFEELPKKGLASYSDVNSMYVNMILLENVSPNDSK